MGANESTDTPEVRSCVHTWQKVENASGPNGEMTVMCPKCSHTRLVNQPKVEKAQDDRPLLTEG